ncbi:heavy metal translocating P-type ATPase [Paradevosia shaoguanensis]|uniref:P-type Zn(2+) transporter n=1 Tax=Paradevosia shaoguanensis TaxID=1335043 RepID=A0AA41QMK9_9HYPH|nr:heavy metal translocating P-type ATPase [Paradevosia shaoguanensis]MCF1742464.1 cadmium-translocating P-type ATPase [Paradevosia shaoguanensis]MCI0126947.1 cadmium-translocating P-type ATPase [Paradevosia shaoguanensis]
MFAVLRNHSSQILVAIAALGIAAGFAANLISPELPRIVWSVTTLPVLLALLLQIWRSLRAGDVGLDVVAALSMVSALLIGESLAANVVALMYAGGQLLEDFASGRARREMTALIGRVSHSAMRYQDGGLVETPIAALQPGDRLMIRHGEVLPVDGKVSQGVAVLDQSALTGEPLPVQRQVDEEALSGSTNTGPTFDMVATRPASESTYAAIVRLVQSAQESKAPMTRLADRYAMVFLIVTVVLAAAAWYFSGDARRAVAVLVVATPCPLIIAVPVAIISGMSRSARIGALIKGGDVLEALAQVRTAVLDKTGTLTRGYPEIEDVRSAPGRAPDELLRLAASLDQASTHVMATSLIEAAKARGLQLVLPTSVAEDAGAGLEGVIDGHRVVVGGSGYVRSKSASGDPATFRDGLKPGQAVVAVAVDGAVAGIIVMADPMRDDAQSLLDSLRQAGIKRITLASGDRQDVVDEFRRELHLDDARGDLTPDQKVAVVSAEREHGPVLMVGDGVNDAPALAAADVGVAMGARGTAASSEAAGLVLLVDKLSPLVEALKIAHRSLGIAKQSVFVGLGLSFAGMIAAALGYLPPVQGALLQEAIDIIVIFNALRALR